MRVDIFTAVDTGNIGFGCVTPCSLSMLVRIFQIIRLPVIEQSFLRADIIYNLLN
jgi:hypothetical protein